jgi:8-hydroxy-5-deazaflavin:NADPH oxidoreductase
MKIAILGAGLVGGALGRLWAAKTHHISFGVPDPNSQRARAAVQELAGRGKAMTNERAVEGADVVVLAVRWGAAEQALRQTGDISGKVLVDATNPLTADLTGLVIGNTWSAGEQVQAWTGARVVKAFNTLGAVLFGISDFGGIQADGLYCGDDATAKMVVGSLISETGLNPVDAGPLRNARLLEPMAVLWIDLANRGWGRNHAYKLLRRPPRLRE